MAGTMRHLAAACEGEATICAVRRSTKLWIALSAMTVYITVMADIIHRLDDRVSHWHALLADRMEADLAARLAAFGVTPAQWRLLVVLARGEANSVSGVARALSLDSAAATRLVARAVARGLVNREADAGDARITRLSLSGLGQARLPAMIDAADAHERHWFGQLNFTELRQYKALLARLLSRSGDVPDAVWLRQDLLMGG